MARISNDAILKRIFEEHRPCNTYLAFREGYRTYQVIWLSLHGVFPPPWRISAIKYLATFERWKMSLNKKLGATTLSRPAKSGARRKMM